MTETQSFDFVKTVLRRVLQFLEKGKMQEAIELLKETLKVLE